MITFDHYVTERIAKKGMKINLFGSKVSEENESSQDSKDGSFERYKHGRQSTIISQTIVQAALMSNLHKTLQPRLRNYDKAALFLSHVGMALMAFGLIEPFFFLIDIFLGSGDMLALGACILINCLINKFLLQLCFVDIIVRAMIFLALFNGYMPDDTTLTLLAAMQGYGEMLTSKLRDGVEKEKEKQASHCREVLEEPHKTEETPNTSWFQGRTRKAPKFNASSTPLVHCTYWEQVHAPAT